MLLGCVKTHTRRHSVGSSPVLHRRKLIRQRSSSDDNMVLPSPELPLFEMVEEMNSSRSKPTEKLYQKSESTFPFTENLRRLPPNKAPNHNKLRKGNEDLNSNGATAFEILTSQSKLMESSAARERVAVAHGQFLMGPISGKPEIPSLPASGLRRSSITRLSALDPEASPLEIIMEDTDSSFHPPPPEPERPIGSDQKIRRRSQGSKEFRFPIEILTGETEYPPSPVSSHKGWKDIPIPDLVGGHRSARGQKARSRRALSEPSRDLIVKAMRQISLNDLPAPFTDANDDSTTSHGPSRARRNTTSDIPDLTK